MKSSVKKVLRVLLGVVAVVAIAAWYFFPIYTYKLNYQNDDLKMKYLVLKPSHVDNLVPPPQEWSTVKFGGISLKIPLYRFSKVKGADTSLSFFSNSEILSIGDLAPTTGLMDVIKKRMK